jgi:hypothetical protein
VHMKTAHKEQPTICLRHMEEKFGGLTMPKKRRARTQHGVPTNQLADMDGPNICHRQPRLRYAGVEDKLIAETRQHMRSNSRFWGIKLEPSLPNFPTWVVIMGMDLETLLQSVEHMDVSTMRKLMPINGETDSNSIFQNSMGIYIPKNFWIGCWLLKRFLNSTRYPMNNKSLWWYTHSGEELLRGGNN